METLHILPRGKKEGDSQVYGQDASSDYARDNPVVKSILTKHSSKTDQTSSDRSQKVTDPCFDQSKDTSSCQEKSERLTKTCDVSGKVRTIDKNM